MEYESCLASQNFENEKFHHLKNGTLFEDPIFSGRDAFLLNQSTQSTFGITWKRPYDLFVTPKLFKEGDQLVDRFTGHNQNKWFQAAVTALSSDTILLNQVIPQGQSFSRDYAGIFQVKLWRYGKWITLVVDDRLPVDATTNRLLSVFASSEELWIPILEKAYAKVLGNYEYLSTISGLDALEDFTGGISEIHDTSLPEREMYSIMRIALDRKSLIICYDANLRDTSFINPKSYFMISKISLLEDPYEIFYKLRTSNEDNPLDEEIKKAYRTDSHFPRSSEASFVSSPDEVWIDIDQLHNMITLIGICHIPPKTGLCPVGDANCLGWDWKEIHGSWQINENAGGSSFYAKTYHLNPQHVIRVTSTDPYHTDDLSTVIVGLMQKYRKVTRKKKRSTELLPIGFQIYSVRHRGVLRASYLWSHDPVCTTKYRHIREMTKRYRLPVGNYVIIPSTRMPQRTAGYMLRVLLQSRFESNVSRSVVSNYRSIIGYVALLTVSVLFLVVLWYYTKGQLHPPWII